VSRRIVIMGAAGRDFHNFNTAFRDDPSVEVVSFTATQIPFIAGRLYPPELAGALYPRGIPIVVEEELERVLVDARVDEVVFAYSDVSHVQVMHFASRVLACGADFRLMGPNATMLRADVPVVAVCAVRTGAGKSQTTRRVVNVLREAGLKVVVVRHPMPYGDLAQQACQRFASMRDIEDAGCTIEEREEYEPHLAAGTVVYAGVDYARVLARAQAEAEVLVWDGGNNDLPFYRPDLHLVVVDPLRAGHERAYHPGEANVRLADAVVINKVDSAEPGKVASVEVSVHELNPRAVVVRAASPVTVENPDQIRGARVLVVEDGPTLTHGGMEFGAGVVAASAHGASEIVDPRPYAVGSVAEAYRRFAHLGPVLPAMGYRAEQLRELESTINATPADLVLVATPVDLRRLIDIRTPALRVSYELAEIGHPNVADLLEPVVAAALKARTR